MQMARLFGHLQHAKFAKITLKISKVGAIFFECQVILQKIAKGFQYFAKVAKFRQISSHWHTNLLMVIGLG